MANRLVLRLTQSDESNMWQLGAPHALNLVQLGSRDLRLLGFVASYLSDIQQDYVKSLDVRKLMLETQLANFKPDQGGSRSGDKSHEHGNAAQRPAGSDSTTLSETSRGGDKVARLRSDSVATTLSGIARVHQALGNTTDALAAFEEVARLLKQHAKGGPSLRLAKVLDSIGLIYFKTERFKGALLRFEESLTIKESITGPSSQAEIAVTLERIADSYYHQGYFEVSLQKYQRVMELLTVLHGERHREVARILCMIGLVLCDLQRFDEAMVQYNRALDVVQVDGVVDVFGATVHINMAKCYQCQARYDEVLQHYKQAVELQKQHFTDRDGYTSICQTLEDMAYVYCVLGAYEESAGRLRESLVIMRDVYGPNDSRTAKLQFDLAVQLNNLGKKEEAYDLVCQAHTTLSSQMSSPDPKAGQAAQLRSELSAQLRPEASGQTSTPQSVNLQYIAFGRKTKLLDSIHLTPGRSTGKASSGLGSPQPGSAGPRSSKKTQVDEQAGGNPQSPSAQTPRSALGPRSGSHVKRAAKREGDQATAAALPSSLTASGDPLAVQLTFPSPSDVPASPGLTESDPNPSFSPAVSVDYVDVDQSDSPIGTGASDQLAAPPSPRVGFC